MSDNILQTLQHLVQDVIAPDVRELKVRLGALEQQVEIQFKALRQTTDAQFERVDAQISALSQRTDAQITALSQKIDAQFQAIVAAISESKAQNELTNVRVFAGPSERVAVLESRQNEAAVAGR